MSPASGARSAQPSGSEEEERATLRLEPGTTGWPAAAGASAAPVNGVGAGQTLPLAAARFSGHDDAVPSARGGSAPPPASEGHDGPGPGVVTDEQFFADLSSGLRQTTPLPPVSPRLARLQEAGARSQSPAPTANGYPSTGAQPSAAHPAPGPSSAARGGQLVRRESEAAGLERIFGDTGYDTAPGPFDDDLEELEPELDLRETTPMAPRQVPVPRSTGEALLAEWEDQPTSLFKGRTQTQPPPGMGDRRRTTTSSAIAIATPTALETYQELIGGPLTVERHLAAEDVAGRPGLLPTLFEPDSLVANRYRILGHRVEEAASLDFCRTTAVTSPQQGEGKSVTALNLAVILSEEPNRRVGLIDCNLRHPSIGPLLGLPPEGGLVGIYRRQLTLAEALIRVGDRQLFVLPAGEPYANPAEILRSPLLTAILRKLESEFSLVVIDTPSILPAADVSLLARLVDRFIIVVRAGHTRRDRLADAVRRLEENKVLGLVFNEDEE